MAHWVELLPGGTSVDLLVEFELTWRVMGRVWWVEGMIGQGEMSRLLGWNRADTVKIT